jgi:hypothetical protein
MENLKTNISFNGIHYLEGDDIYIFNDGIQESEKSSKTIIITKSSNNYIIEIFNNKFLYDCISKADLVLYCVLQEDKLVATENSNTHTFYYEDNNPESINNNPESINNNPESVENDKLVYKYEKHNDNNYQELGFFTGSKINM